MKYFGAHVSAAGGVDNAPGNAVKIGAKAFALFVKNQRQWQAKPLETGVVASFKERLAEHSFSPKHIMPHAGYLINLANPDPEAWARSVASFTDEMGRCAELGLVQINIHPGSHLKRCSVEEGIANVARAARQVLAAVEGVTIVFENTAGQGSNLGAPFEELAAIIAAIDDDERVGICLDTAHLYAAGHDIAAKGGYERVMREFDEIVGMRFLRGMHLNDTKIELGKRVDRHALLGEGNLGWEVFEQIARDPRLDDMPLTLETPDEEAWAGELERLNALAR